MCDGAFIEGGAVVGDRVTIKNQVMIFDGVTVGDDVFLGPGVTFTNDMFPRAHIKRAGAELTAHPGRAGGHLGRARRRDLRDDHRGQRFRWRWCRGHR